MPRTGNHHPISPGLTEWPGVWDGVACSGMVHPSTCELGCMLVVNSPAGLFYHTAHPLTGMDVSPHSYH